jgi:hypothetical protein
VVVDGKRQALNSSNEPSSEPACTKQFAAAAADRATRSDPSLPNLRHPKRGHLTRPEEGDRVLCLAQCSSVCLRGSTDGRDVAPKFGMSYRGVRFLDEFQRESAPEEGTQREWSQSAECNPLAHISTGEPRRIDETLRNPPGPTTPPRRGSTPPSTACYLQVLQNSMTLTDIEICVVVWMRRTLVNWMHFCRTDRAIHGAAAAHGTP